MTGMTHWVWKSLIISFYRFMISSFRIYLSIAIRLFTGNSVDALNWLSFLIQLTVVKLKIWKEWKCVVGIHSDRPPSTLVLTIVKLFSLKIVIKVKQLGIENQGLVIVQKTYSSNNSIMSIRYTVKY